MKTIYLALIALTIISCSKEQKNPAPQLAQSLPVLNVLASTATTYQEYPVAIEGAVNVEIRPQIDGRLEKIYIDEGAFVKKGQPLFKIDEQPFRQQYNNALANFHAAEASLLNAKLEVEKLTPLVQNKVVSDYQLQSAKNSVQIVTSNLQQARALLSYARINLDYTLIKAPVEGYVARLPKKPGSLVSVSDPEALTSLSDVHDVRVYFSLAETNFIEFKSQYKGNTIAEKIKNLPPVSLILSDNSVFTEKGKIDMVDGQFDENTGAITLRATFPNNAGLLRSGNTGKIQLGLIHSNTILIPQQSTIEVQDKLYVFVLDKHNKVSKQVIGISGTSGNDYLVSSGIKPGDRIVSKGFENLQDGNVVNPQNEIKTIAQN